MDEYSLKLELRIDWSEVDLFGHVNNLAIMKYVQAARVNYLERIGLMQLQQEAKKGPILASTSCQFRKPLFYPGQVTVYSRVEYMKNTSFRMEHGVYNDQSELIAEMDDILVFFDFENHTKLTLPDEIRDKIETIESQRLNLNIR